MGKLFFTLILCICSLQVNAQKNIKGNIFDSETNKPLSGVRVFEYGGITQTVSDSNGFFSMNISDGDTLCFYEVGYETQKKEIGDSLLNVYLNTKSETSISVICVNYFYLTLNDAEYKSLQEKGRSFVYPLLVLNGIVVRDKKMVDYYRNNIDRRRLKTKYVPKEKARKLKILDIPEDGVLLVKTKQGYHFEF